MNQPTIAAYNRFGQVYDQDVDDFWTKFPKATVEAFCKHVKGNQVLNLGSGSGRDAILLREKNLEVYCVDASTTMVEITQKLGFKSEVKDFLELELADKSFNGIWAYTSLLHITKAEVQQMIPNIYQWLDAHGVFLIGMIEGQFEGMKDRQTMPGTQRYFRYYSEKELDDLIIPVGFKKVYQERYTPNTKTYLHQIYQKI